MLPCAAGLLFAGVAAGQAASAPASAGPEAWFREYMAALNAHDVERVMAFYAPDLVYRRLGQRVERSREDWRRIREWEAPMQARFEYEVLSVQGEWLSARLEETNLLYAALDVRRPLVAEYRLENGAIREMNLRSIREAARPWREAVAELEGWLAGKPVAETVDILEDGELVFDGSAARRLLPHLDRWRQALAEARRSHELVLRGFVAALNRHDVDAQYAQYGEGMTYLDEGRQIPPDRESERPDREFERAGNARWSYRVLGAGLDSLTLVLTEDLDFYQALGVGPRSSRRWLRFRAGKIVEMEATEWTQAGRPYAGAREAFEAWLARERPQAAARIRDANGLVFDARTAPLMAPLAREWREARPCTLYHPSLSPREPRLVFSSNCEGRWNVYVAEADGSMPVRLTDNASDSRVPAWSPDGTRVLFQTDRHGNWEIYAVRADGSEPTRLTSDPASDTWASFSPDGASILFVSDRSGARELFLMNADGSDPRQLTRASGLSMRPAWTPDGAEILYPASSVPRAADGEPVQLLRLRRDGTALGPLPGGPRRDYNQAYAPDGRRIAFDAHADGAWGSDDGQWELWSMSAAGSDRKRLTNNAVNDWGPAWSPNGRTIVFLSGMRNAYDIYAMNADGTGIRRLTRWTPNPTTGGGE